MRVITYMYGNDIQIDLSIPQIEQLRAAGVWPRYLGSDIADVSYGEHVGTPTFSATEIQMIVEDEGDISRATAAAKRRKADE